MIANRANDIQIESCRARRIAREKGGCAPHSIQAEKENHELASQL